MTMLGQNERQILGEIADALPMLRHTMQQRLEADSRFQQTERAIRAAKQRRLRALNLDGAAKGREDALWLAVLISVTFCSGCFMAWLSVT